MSIAARLCAGPPAHSRTFSATAFAPHGQRFFVKKEAKTSIVQRPVVIRSKSCRTVGMKPFE